MVDPRATALEDLLGWWAEQGGDPCDAREIADWLWLQANMEGCALPLRFVVRGERGLGSGGDRGGLPLERPSIDPVITDDRGIDSATELDKPPPDPFTPTVFPDPPPDLGEKSQPAAGLFSEAQLPDDGDVRDVEGDEERKAILRLDAENRHVPHQEDEGPAGGIHDARVR